MGDIWVERETSTHVPVPVERDGVVVTDFETALTRWPARPTTWTAAVLAGDVPGLVVTGLTPGTYQVWVRVSGAVVPAGTVEVR